MAFELAVDGQAHYGWMKVEIPFPDLIAGGRILGWAYNSVPGESIFVSQVPEPGTWALLSVGAGLLGWRTWRTWRRRQSLIPV